MKLTLTLFLLSVCSLSLSANVTPSSGVRAVGQVDFAQPRKPAANERHIKRLQIHNRTGLDGKVRGIRLDYEDEDKPGIRAYGLPKKRVSDNGVIERVHVGQDRIDDAARSGRLVEAYGMPKDRVESNGFIERLPSASAGRQSAKLEARGPEEVRARRSVREGSENRVGERVASEAEDMAAQETKVFRPLFVYRQQVAARERQRHARNLAHRHHRHASHHFCDNRRARY